MRQHIKLYEEYTAQTGMLTDRDEIIDWLIKYRIKHFVVNEDLTVSTDGHVVLNHSKFYDLKSLPVKFDVVDGDFYTGVNFETLVGCPNKVTGLFKARGTFKTLEGCPSYIGRNFDCDASANYGDDGYMSTNSQLVDLRGGPEYVGGNYYLSQQDKLKTLEGFPKNFDNTNDKLRLSGNKSLRTLIYAPFKTDKELAAVMGDLGSYYSAPCYTIYEEHGWSSQAHALSLESWSKDEPSEVKGFIERLKVNDRTLYLDIMAESPQLKELVGDTSELTNTYQKVKDIEKGYF